MSAIAYAKIENYVTNESLIRFFNETGFGCEAYYEPINPLFIHGKDHEQGFFHFRPINDEQFDVQIHSIKYPHLESNGHNLTIDTSSEDKFEILRLLTQYYGGTYCPNDNWALTQEFDKPSAHRQMIEMNGI